MRPPAFWYDPDARLAPLLLSPLEAITAMATRHRLAKPGWRAPVPVICCGNLGVGGAGKTTLALDLLRRLRKGGIVAHALTRGYGGRAARHHAILRVDPLRHDVRLTGDEALLLAAQAPTWIAADRAASARAAIADGAQCLVMDDGMQNASLIQDRTLLVIDGEVGFGNFHLLPAGPLRESVVRGSARAHAAILIGQDRHNVVDALPPGLAVLRASLVMGPEAHALRGQKLLAFAGIARPGKFFDALDAIGLAVTRRVGFPDHHVYGAEELRRLDADATGLGAILVTTPKDEVRLPPAFRPRVAAIGVGLQWSDETLLDAMLQPLARGIPGSAR